MYYWLLSIIDLWAKKKGLQIMIYFIILFWKQNNVYHTIITVPI